MNILMLNHNRTWESTFNRAFILGYALSKRDHKVTIVTNSKRNLFSFRKYMQYGITIIETPDLFFGKLRTGWDPSNVLRRVSYLRSKAFDIVLAFDCRPTVIFPALYLKRKLHIPLIIDWADWWGRGGAAKLRKSRFLNRMFEPIETYFEENFRKYADYTTVISSPLKERASKLVADKDRIKIFPSGSDTDHIKAMDKIESRKILGLPIESFILTFSSFVLYDLDLLLKAFKIVLRSKPNSYLIITGAKPKVGNWLREKVILTGNITRDRLNLYLASADICLMPLSNNLANQARFPGKLLDYMAAGRPIVSNPVGEASKVIADYDCGLLTEDNPISFAEGIVAALNDEDKRKIWGSNARRVAEKLFSFDGIARDFEDIYKKLI